jgi:RHS repeat-associated protein
LGAALLDRHPLHFSTAVYRRGISISFKYDFLDRRTGVVYAASDSIRYLYDKVGRVTNVVDSIAGSTKLLYDTLDRVTNVVDINGTITYRYNDASLRTNMTVVGQNAVAYLYDAGNRLTNVVQGTFTTALSYDDDGRRTNLALPNGIKVLYTYDTASRLTNITYQGAATNKIGYSYDQDGNRASQASALSLYNLPSQVTNSTYDAANHQLTFGSYNILYDLNGNVTNIINGTTTNRLVWSARNELTNMLGSAIANFQYDGLGRRVTRTVSGNTEKYVYDGLDIIQQLNNTGTVAANYFRSLAIDEPWQRIDIGSASTNRIYLADALGSTVALTDTNKLIDTQYAYDPFGNTASLSLTNKNCYEFTGRENDGTALYYYRARYYAPALGRFVSEDPIGFVAGPNAYVYVRNSPTLLTDPLGLTWQTNWNYFWQWVFGLGDTTRTYGPNSVELQEMQSSTGADFLRQSFVNNGCINTYNLEYNTGTAYYDTLLNPYTADWSSTAAEVGGFGGASVVINGDGTVTYTIVNLSGTKSFFFHLVPDRTGTTGWMRTITQTFQWAEPSPCECQ